MDGFLRSIKWNGPWNAPLPITYSNMNKLSLKGKKFIEIIYITIDTLLKLHDIESLSGTLQALLFFLFILSSSWSKCPLHDRNIYELCKSCICITYMAYEVADLSCNLVRTPPFHGNYHFGSSIDCWATHNQKDQLNSQPIYVFSSSSLTHDSFLPFHSLFMSNGSSCVRELSCVSMWALKINCKSFSFIHPFL